MSEEASRLIKNWLREMAELKEAEDLNLENFDSTMKPCDVINNDKNISEVRIKNVPVSTDQFSNKKVLTGDGVLTFSNGDYFEGEFFGSVGHRSGVLTRVAENGLKTTATWKNGLIQVNKKTENTIGLEGCNF